LAERTGAAILMGARAEADFTLNPLQEGSELDLGRVRLRIIETPGHTPESICILVHRDRREVEPHAVLTGDTLFIGDVGRPDLLASMGADARVMAGCLYDSIHEKLLALPAHTLVYPGQRGIDVRQESEP
jgi:glyoxylase-like metal-dependent hydrolase (beta-lactamase superfamily II)